MKLNNNSPSTVDADASTMPPMKKVKLFTNNSPADVGASTTPRMKKVKLELGRAAGFVDKDDSGIKLSTAASPNRGLRHFSMKVCEKVEEKGTTTYNEVADELVREIKAEDEMAALERGEPIPDKSIDKKNNDDKNIRRRVYDALNVLMAMDIITKDSKQITWRGLPGGTQEAPSMNATSGLSRNQRMQKLETERLARMEEVNKKKACLEELMVQNVCFQNLLGRNHGMEMQERQKGGIGNVEKIPLPLIVVNTSSKAVVQCEMSPDRTNVNFDFSLPFEINDDNQILKRLGMDYTSQEELERSLPPELYKYCYNSGIIDKMTQK